MTTKDKVLLLCDVPWATTLDQDLGAELAKPEWKTEAQILQTLQALGHPCELFGVFNNTDLIRQKIQAYQPDVIFNQVECFNQISAYDQNIVSYLELQGVPFTGCGSVGLTLCKHKAISKQILSYHRVRVPEFTVVPRGRPPVRPKRLKFPIFIKPLKQEASYGIAQASFVETDDQFKQRATFIHERFEQDAIAEEYIDGRELYVSILGNGRLRVLPIRELKFKEVPEDEPKIATFKAKWDEAYRQRWGIENYFASDLEPAVVQRINRTCRRIYRLLAIDGYARLDLRLTPDGQIVFIEANPNPVLARDEDFAESARKANLPYPKLIERIVSLAKTAVRE